MLRRFWQIALVLLSALITLQAQQPAASPSPQSATPQPPKTHLKVGQAAPDFTLPDTGGKRIKLSDFKGQKNVVLAFYVLAFTGG